MRECIKYRAVHCTFLLHSDLDFMNVLLQPINVMYRLVHVILLLNGSKLDCMQEPAALECVAMPVTCIVLLYADNASSRYIANSQLAANLQLMEDLEQLKVLENGYKIKVIIVHHRAHGVDEPEDVASIEQRMHDMGLT